MNFTKPIFLLPFFIFLSYLAIKADEPGDSLLLYDDFLELDEIVVKGEAKKKLKYSAGNTELITAVELTRAACCNLGESFTTNPSVDVSYNDAATGARQIRLLGLSGSYVQMLTENVPAFRGIASNYGLSYVPGPWLQSIQLSKGASSVKNGYESITGQINIELKKPQNDRQLNVNAYADSDGKIEVNADGNLHFGKKWSGGLLIHGENAFLNHDANDDGFIDMPKIKQVSLQNRWAYLGTNYVFQIAAKGMIEKRKSGQIGHYHSSLSSTKETQAPYIINIDSRRLEFFTKNAYILDKENDGNVAMILSGSLHNQNSSYGLRIYDGLQWEGYASLMFERRWRGMHFLSTGLSFNYDNYRQHYRFQPLSTLAMDRLYENEGVAGIYGQYTFDYEGKVIAMGGIRYDYSSLYGSFVTPRLHFRYNPNGNISLHASLGTGRRSPHPLVEFSYLLASSREIYLPRELKMEKGFNTGVDGSWTFYFGSRKYSLSAEYYFTRFSNQLAVDLDLNPHAAYISCDNMARSHAFQAEIEASIISDMSLTAAYRFTDVKINYGYGFIAKPLTSKHKGLLTLSYTPLMGIWQFDATLTINGGGTMPKPYQTGDGVWSWNKNFPTYCRLNLQATRNFRYWSVYIGGENITNYKQKNPIIEASNPWGKDFDATMVWGPLQGAMIYVGFRYNITKY